MSVAMAINLSKNKRFKLHNIEVIFVIAKAQVNKMPADRISDLEEQSAAPEWISGKGMDIFWGSHHPNDSILTQVISFCVIEKLML